jgi:isopenicillin-N epimerase
MGVVRLPLRGAATTERTQALRRRMLEAGTDAPLHVQADAVWLRLSAAAYNELADYEKLAETTAKVIADEG